MAAAVVPRPVLAQVVFPVLAAAAAVSLSGRRSFALPGACDLVANVCHWRALRAHPGPYPHVLVASVAEAGKWAGWVAIAWWFLLRRRL